MKRKPMLLEMADVINAYQATGRVVTVFPYVGLISLNGAPRMSYAHAMESMRHCLTHLAEKEEHA